MRNQLSTLIVKRLDEQGSALKKQFAFQHPIKVARHFALDNLLPTEIAMQIYQSFPKPKKMHLLHSRGELKLKYVHIKEAASLLQDISVAFQDPKVIAAIEEITGINNQVPDPAPTAGGISTLLKGYYINPHLDSSHDRAKKLYRTVNVLYYVSPNWGEDNGGNYELWNESVTQRILVPSYFNRLVVMETNSKSWHAVNPVLCDQPRCCVFNYFYSSQSPEGREYFHASPTFSFYNPLFKARPEQKIRRAIGNFRDSLLGNNL